MIEDYYDSLAYYHLESDANNNETYEATGTTFQGYIEQLGGDESIIYDERTGYVYRLFCDKDTGLKEGDKIMDGSLIYKIKTINKYKTGINTHLECILIKME